MAIDVRSSGEVSASFTITADSPNRLGQMIRAIGAALEALDETSSGSAASAATPAEWYRDHGRAFYDRLQDAARTALRTMVAEGPTVPFATINAATGRSGSRLAGSLASIGAAKRRMQAPAPPFEADHKRKVYTMDPTIRSALQRVLPGSADG